MTKHFLVNPDAEIVNTKLPPFTDNLLGEDSREDISGAMEKEMTKYVTIEWRLNPKFITDLPKTAKEKLIESCNSNKFILVKVSTIDFEKTKGTFRCN